MKKYVAVLISLYCLCFPQVLTAQDIPMPGDDTAIPMPGDDAIPVPGEEESDVPASAPVMPSSFSSALEFRGYGENTSTVEYLTQPEEEVVLNAGRVRVNMSGEPDRFGADIPDSIFESRNLER